jgi:prepilin-type processing-associated H-X9-DG protein
MSRDGTQGAANAYPNQISLPKSYLIKLSQVYDKSVPLADTELVADVVVSEGTGQTSDKFSDVYPSNRAELPKGYNSSHMSGRLPGGGNILFMDNHVSWRRFRDMKAWGKWNTIGMSGSDSGLNFTFLTLNSFV